MLDEIRPKTFSAWIIPGIITPPFIITKLPQVSVDTILNILCEKYHTDRSFLEPGTIDKERSIAEGKIPKKERRRDRVLLRQMFYYLMRDLYKEKATLVWLGGLLEQDHTTVMHSVKSFADRIDSDEKMPPIIAKKKIGPNRTVRGDYFDLQQRIRPWL